MIAIIILLVIAGFVCFVLAVRAWRHEHPQLTCVTEEDAAENSRPITQVRKLPVARS
jgi:hypothetical protein